MLVQACLAVLSVAAVCGASEQRVLGADRRRVSWQEPDADAEAHARNATDALLFSSIASLLQQWPNTRYRNGHTIVKGTIPRGTVLYHARGDENVPLGPEWTAFNVDHSYLLCPGVCWMLTVAVEQDLNVVYFDGSSAANAYMGHQDSQDVVLWGRIRRDKTMAEWERIQGLCKWGEPYGVDAFIRMEHGFEVMLCDFTKKTRLVSSIHIMNAIFRPFILDGDSSLLDTRQSIRFGGSNVSTTLQDLPPPRPPPGRPPPTSPIPPNWKGPLRDAKAVSLAGVESAGWNSFYPGEVRAKLDYSRMISFYDPTYASLVEARKGLPRSKHRLQNVSSEDLDLAMAHLHADLTREEADPSGVDWSTLTRNLMDRYGERLYQLKLVLSESSVEKTGVTTSASNVRSHLFTMLTPYMVYGALPTQSSKPSPFNTSWLEPIYHHCSKTIPNGIPDEGLTRSERLIKGVVERVLQRICATLADMWADAFSVTEATEREAIELLSLWRGQLADLMNWLDWTMWDVCSPACPEEKFCYIRMWPWGMEWAHEDVDVIDMTPRCIDREDGNLGIPDPRTN